MILLSILAVLVLASTLNLLYYYNYYGSTIPERILSAPADVIHYADLPEFLDALRDLVLCLGLVTLWLSTPVTFILAVIVRSIYEFYLKVLTLIEVYVLNK